MNRSRWAAVGAAVAVSLGAGSVGLIQATSPSGAAAFVAITPCRLFDTRPEFQVGPRSAPLGQNDTHSVGGSGDVGECEIPAAASGLVLNVTTVGATEPTFLTVWPSGEARPNASHLNPSPGAPPTPNAVTTDLGADHNFSIYNAQGSVHVFADLVGYYTDHHHDDRYYTKAQSDGALSSKADTAAVATRAQTITIPSYDFHPTFAGAEAVSAPFAAVVSGATYLGAGLSLPVGSTITSVTYRYTDAHADLLRFGLVTVAPGDGSGEFVAGSMFESSSNDVSVREATIDGLAYVVEAGVSLAIHATSPAWLTAGSALRVYNVELSYALP